MLSFGDSEVKLCSIILKVLRSFVIEVVVVLCQT